jgi:urease accessory protein
MTTLHDPSSNASNGAPHFDHSSFDHSDFIRHSNSEFRHSPAGAATLEFSFINQRTTLTRHHATAPLRILTPRTGHPAASVYTSSFGGGLLAGDHLQIHATLHENTTAYLASQSSTKIYRSSTTHPARQSLHATLHDNALLVLAPDPIVPFAHSRYEQFQSFHLAPSASLILLDWYTSGRRARGEHWHLASLKTRNEINLDARRILTDTLHLTPAHGTLAGPFRMACYHCFATLIMLGPRVAAHSQHLLSYVNGRPIDPAPDAPLLVAASPLADGLILRLASTTTEHASQALRSSLACLSDLLGEHPWNRKW